MMCPLTPSDVRMEQRRQSHDFIREGRVEHSDRILAMKQQEDTKYCYAIYLSHSSSLIEDKLSIRSAIDPLMRERICLWTFRVVDHCNFSRQIAERSVSYFDRCLASCGKVLLSEQTTWYVVAFWKENITVYYIVLLLVLHYCILTSFIFQNLIKAHRSRRALLSHQNSSFCHHRSSYYRRAKPQSILCTTNYRNGEFHGTHAVLVSPPTNGFRVCLFYHIFIARGCTHEERYL